MRVMLVGDVIGRPGRKAFRENVQKLRKEKNIDVVIVNGENSASGKGLTRNSLDELYSGGADIVTTGNHVTRGGSFKRGSDYSVYNFRDGQDWIRSRNDGLRLVFTVK